MTRSSIGPTIEERSSIVTVHAALRALAFAAAVFESDGDKEARDALAELAHPFLGRGPTELVLIEVRLTALSRRDSRRDAPPGMKQTEAFRG